MEKIKNSVLLTVSEAVGSIRVNLIGDDYIRHPDSLMRSGKQPQKRESICKLQLQKNMRSANELRTQQKVELGKLTMVFGRLSVLIIITGAAV